MPLPIIMAAKAAWGLKTGMAKAQAIFKIGAQIKGFFGGKRDEANRRAQNRMYRNYANTSTQNMMNLIPEEREYASARSGFLRERGELKQASILDSYEGNFDKVSSGAAKTGFAYGADENIRQDSVLSSFQQQTSVAQLGQAEQYM